MSHAPKPFQLEFKTDRDNLNRWWSNLTNFCRQNADQLPFFKGGAHQNWISEFKDPTCSISWSEQGVHKLTQVWPGLAVVKRAALVS